MRHLSGAVPISLLVPVTVGVLLCVGVLFLFGQREIHVDSEEFP